MDNTLLKGIWKYMMPIPPFLWKKQIYKMAGKAKRSIQFMTKDHHLVRNYLVKTLPETGQPVSLKSISDTLNLPFERVLSIVDELEKNKFFLFRNDQGEVAWAYPVTTDKTPHKAIFSTGENINSA